MSYQHILLPTDGSPLSERAARAGIDLASALGARVTALYVAPAPTPVVFEGLMPVGLMTSEEHAAAIERAAARFLGVIQKAAQDAGVPFEGLSVTSEYPAETIVDTAVKRHCDLIFMASHGRKGVTALLLGSETAKVLTHARTPVLVHRSAH
ncbi:MAG TPA: universal stress protein [Burkholderiaceae bacterium]|nr:universal stress protein [Burkholderiaceae bacterium]